MADEEQKRRAFLVVGLGNPGIEYQWTPHNAGFLAIDRLAQQYGVAVANRRCRSLTVSIRIGGQHVVLAKPETYMNLSGIALAALVREFEADPQQDLLVLYDELDLAFGTLRVRERGSPGGHNGAWSISGTFGTDEWARVRIGVGPDGPETMGRRGKDYLLTPMRKTDLAVLDTTLDVVAQAVETVVTRGVGPAMNEFNGRGGTAV